MEMARETHFKSYGKIIRHGYLEWMKKEFPNYAGRIEQVREMQRREVSGRVKEGVMKRTSNIQKAHDANRVGKPDKSKAAAVSAAKASTKQARRLNQRSKPEKPGSV